MQVFGTNIRIQYEYPYYLALYFSHSNKISQFISFVSGTFFLQALGKLIRKDNRDLNLN